MPESGVYQMPPFFVFCLPRVCQLSSVSSAQRTSSVFSPSSSSSVMSAEKGR